jgi:hypothetical protein
MTMTIRDLGWDAATGTLGAYRPVEWTSGSLESIDISTTAALEAKLPLGVVSLGGRVSAGEKCLEAYNTIKTDGPKIKDPDSDNPRLQNPTGNLGTMGAMCMARAGDCDGAYKLFKDSPDPRWPKDDAGLRPMFDAVIGTVIQKCKGK